MSETSNEIAAELLRRLAEDGEHPSEATLAWAKAQGEAVVEPLLDLMEDEELGYEESVGQGWVPLHATALLGSLGAESAIPRMLQAMVDLDFDEEMALWDQMARSLAELGEAVVEPALKLLAEASDAEERSTLRTMLAQSDSRDPRVFAVLRGDLEAALAEYRADEPGADERLWKAAYDVVIYANPETAPLVATVVDALEVDESGGPRANMLLRDFIGLLEEWEVELTPEQNAKRERLDELRAAAAAPLPEVDSLDDDEWNELGEFLAQPGGPSQAGVDGFMHGIASAPSLIKPTEWLGAVLAERKPNERILSLIMRHYNAVCDGLAGKNPWLPPPTQEEAIRDWCMGYMFCFHIDPKWPDVPGAVQDLAPIAVLAGELSLADLTDEPIDDEAAWLQEMREDLEFSIVEIYDRLSGARMASAEAATTPVRREGPKVGRNDPCPCGSGKKYKKCCLQKLN